MSLISRLWSHRLVVAYIAAGMILGLLVGSYLSGSLASDVERIALLFGSIALVVGLLLLFGAARKRAKASAAGKGTGATYLAVIAFVAMLTSLSVILDLAPTDWIRAMPALRDHLPQGNLLMAGGPDGWLYVVLVVLIFVTAYADFLAYLGFRPPVGTKVDENPAMKDNGPTGSESGSWNLQDEMSRR